LHETVVKKGRWKGLTDGIDIKDVTKENVDDLCGVCVTSCVRGDPDWMRGWADKKKWAAEMLPKWGSFAKVAYESGNPAGMIQYRPLAEERVVAIDCMYVPMRAYWGKGIGSSLLRSLMEDVEKPMRWFDNRRPLALVTKTFHGGEPEQYAAREFFTRKGFRRIGEDPDYLYYPLQPGFVYRPAERKPVEYVPQNEDQGKVVLISGPDYCPATYPFFLKRMEKYIRDTYPKVPVRWIDPSQEPEEVKKRNVSVGDCVVNARLIRSCVLDKDRFQEEVRNALKDVRQGCES
jgi:GNAT superfamily N-acetyltransferase